MGLSANTFSQQLTEQLGFNLKTKGDALEDLSKAISMSEKKVLIILDEVDQANSKVMADMLHLTKMPQVCFIGI